MILNHGLRAKYFFVDFSVSLVLTSTWKLWQALPALFVGLGSWLLTLGRLAAGNAIQLPNNTRPANVFVPGYYTLAAKTSDRDSNLQIAMAKLNALLLPVSLDG